MFIYVEILKAEYYQRDQNDNKKQLDNNDNNKGNEKKNTKKTKVYSTRYSQAVTHPSTNRTQRCLTSVIGREPVFST